MTDVVTLYQVARGDRFVFGPRIRCRMRPDGSLRAETWRDRWASELAEKFWPSPRLVVTSIDRERGVITMGPR